MEGKQKQKMSKYITVRDYLLANAAITNTIPGFQNFFTSFQNNLLQLLSLAESQDFDKSGLTDVKAQIKKTLLQLCFTYYRNLRAYAVVTGNAVLQKEVQMSDYELSKMPDIDLKTKAQALYDRAQSNLAALANYGISAATQTSMQTAIANFTSNMTKPRLGQVDKKEITKQIAVLMQTQDGLLKNIDVVIELVHFTQPTFYSGYQSAGIVVQRGKSVLSFKAKVIDGVTGEAIKGAVVEVWHFDAATGLGKVAAAVTAKPVFLRRTATLGGVKEKNMPAGTYEVRVKKGGYAEFVTTMVVTDGEMTSLEIVLTK